MSAATKQTTLVDDDDIGRVTRDDDGHLRSCPVCAAEWPEWDATEDGPSPLAEHLAEFHFPEDFGLTPLRGVDR